MLSRLLILGSILSLDIKHAFHALALDEHIKPFTPTLWHLPQDHEQRPQGCEKDLKHLDAEFRKLLRNGSKATEAELSKAWRELIEVGMKKQLKGFNPDLQQVWFPGGHVNIGGGNPAILSGFSFDFERK